MTAAFLLYAGLLLLEGGLAWVLGGEAFLLMATTAALALYASLRHTSRAVAEGVRLLTALLLAIAGPIHYQGSLIPLVLCFMALPHFLAATQALREKPETSPSPVHPGLQSTVFTIAFYTSLGLVLVLAMGMTPQLSRPVTNSLAVLVLVMALTAWEHSRLPRLRPAQAPSSSGWIKRHLFPAALLAAGAFTFSYLLPPAAEWLCRLSPRWRMDPIAFKNKPPKPPPTALEAKPSSSNEATRLGVDESAITGQHRLPPRSNLSPSEGARFYVQPETATLTPHLLAHGPAYLRSHTLNKFHDNQWSPEVTGGVWLEDSADGQTDGTVTLRQPPNVPVIPHEVFALDADGYTLPALAGLTAVSLPRVFAIPGDVLQSSATGDIRYRAVSAPVLFSQLPQRPLLTSAPPSGWVPHAPLAGETGQQLRRLAESIFRQETSLDQQVTALRAFLGEHYTYSAKMENPHNLGALENFLFDERKGHCDFYASAAALLLRQVGVPTRIAYGFASTEADPATGLIIFRDRHAHAWTEIALKDYGWTICDFTPANHIGQPKETALPPPALPKPDPKSFTEAALDAKIPTPARAVETPSLLASLTEWSQQQPWLQPVLQHGPIAVLVLALLAIAAQWLRRDPARRSAAAQALKTRTDYEQQPPYFKEFLRLSAVAGQPKPEARTPWEHYQVLEQAGLPVPPLRPLIDYHCDTRYADAPRDATREQRFSQDLQAFAETLPQMAAEAITS